MAPCTHPGTSREVNEARRPHTCRRPCVFEEEKKTKKSAPPKTHHDIHSSPATATTSRRRSTRHIPRVSPYTPASIDPGLVEIGLVQLSQLPMAKTASVASFTRPVFLQQMVQKEENKKQPITATSNRHSDPHRASHSFKTARPRSKDSQTRSELGETSCRPLWARHRLGRKESTIFEQVQTSPSPAAFSREPQKHHKSDGGRSTSYC